MTTLASAALEIARVVTDVVDSIATGGSTTTLVDGAFPRKVPPDDAFNYGVIWFRSGNNSGKMAAITDWASATGTFTFTTQSGACASTNTYSASFSDYPMYVLKRAVNAAISRIGDVPKLDTSLTTVANQMTYDRPAGVYNVKRVEVATRTSSPYNFQPHYWWVERNDDIMFDEGFQPVTAGYTIRLTYQVPASELTSDTGAVSDYININYLKWEGAAYCLRWKISQVGNDMPEKKTDYAEALAQAERNAAAHRPNIQQIPRDPHLSAWGGGATIDEIGEPGSVRI